MNPNEPDKKTTESLEHSHIWKIIPALVLFIVLVIIFVLFTGNKHTNIKNESSIATQVSITDKVFIPETVQIKSNSSVRWLYNGSSVHIVAADPFPTHNELPELVSPPLHSGDSYLFTFNTPGTFTYHDDKNPLSLRGTVIVK